MALVVTVILWKNTTWLTKSLFLPHNQDLNQLNKSGKGACELNSQAPFHYYNVYKFSVTIIFLFSK